MNSSRDQCCLFCSYVGFILTRGKHRSAQNFFSFCFTTAALWWRLSGFGALLRPPGPPCRAGMGKSTAALPEDPREGARSVVFPLHFQVQCKESLCSQHLSSRCREHLNDLIAAVYRGGNILQTASLPACGCAPLPERCGAEAAGPPPSGSSRSERFSTGTRTAQAVPGRPGAAPGCGLSSGRRGEKQGGGPGVAAAVQGGGGAGRGVRESERCRQSRPFPLPPGAVPMPGIAVTPRSAPRSLSPAPPRAL